MHSSRSVDSRGFFCFSMMAGYPTEARKMANKNLAKISFLKSGICFEIIRHLPGLGRVPYHHEPRGETWEPTDLAEYIFLGINNFSQVQIILKLKLSEVG